MNHTTWTIPDTVFDVLIGGKSILDSKNHFVGEFDSPVDVDRFLVGYGFHVDDPVEQAELMGHMHEAIRFISNKFLKPGNPEGLDLEVPRKISELTDPRELLLMTSKESVPSQLRAWACAVLKVVHTLSHMDRDVRNYYFGDIQRQILDRFYRYIHRSESGQLYLGRTENDPMRIDLIAFDVKPKKARESTLIKLLQKPESVAEELFDRVGVRFITKNKVDAVRAIQFLDQMRVVVAANIKPSRSRNTLVDVPHFKSVLKEGAANEDELRLKLENAFKGEVDSETNVHSSRHYRSIQFTCRQLIKIANPIAEQIRAAKLALKKATADAAITEAIEKMDHTSVPRVVRFFYPFEVQVVDQHSHEENERGRSAHSEYKKAQLQTALSRVMQGVMRAYQP